MKYAEATPDAGVTDGILTRNKAVDEAMSRYAIGDRSTAQALLMPVLAADSDNLRALYLHGTLLLHDAKFEQAAASFQRGIEKSANSSTPSSTLTGLWVNLGIALRALGRISEALAAYQAALAVDPANPECWINFGNCCIDHGDASAAEGAYLRCLQIKPDYPRAYENLGRLLLEQGRLQEAAAKFKKAASLDPGSNSALVNLGGTLLQLDQPEAARAALAGALEIDHTDYAAWNNLAEADRRLDALDDAVDSARAAIRINPNFAPAHITLARCMVDMQDYASATISYSDALRIEPDRIETRYNYARSLRKTGRFEEARSELQDILKRDPGFIEAHNALGALCYDLVETDKALALFDETLRRDPDHALAHWNRSLLLLLLRDYRRGFTEAEWRENLRKNTPLYPDIPLWKGEDLDGKRLLVRAEQGFGDTVQFSRFLPQLSAIGATVTLECQAGLGSLMKESGLAADVIEAAPLDERQKRGKTARSTEPPRFGICDFDVQVWLMSLPHLLDLEFDAVPTQTPYLRCSPAHVERWYRSLANRRDLGDGDFRVGIVWAGSRKNSNDHARSTRITQFEALAAIPGVSLISLQQGPAVTQLKDWSHSRTVIVPQPNVRSFIDTAALVKNLDLIVTVDTVVAHIAGALACPVWTVIPYGPDWRWSLESIETPWYPTMRLFRQPKPGDWDSVFENVARELAALVGSGQNRRAA